MVRSLAVAAVVALTAGATVAGAGGVARLACKPRIVNRVVRYCGPATARLSVFSGVTFKNGSCKRQGVGALARLTVVLGARSQNAATNSGLPYFGLTVSGPLSRPTGGGVIAYWKSKRWGGRGVSFRGNASGGTFVARGINGSSGIARGSFRC
jgi:hypothetical protein